MQQVWPGRTNVPGLLGFAQTAPPPTSPLYALNKGVLRSVPWLSADWRSSPQDRYVTLKIAFVLCHLSASGNDVPQRQNRHLSLTVSPSEQA